MANRMPRAVVVMTMGYCWRMKETAAEEVAQLFRSAVAYIIDYMSLSREPDRSPERARAVQFDTQVVYDLPSVLNTRNALARLTDFDSASAVKILDHYIDLLAEV